MLLSEAIRLGAKFAPQSFGHFRDRETLATCALGATAEALRMRGLPFKTRRSWCLENDPVDCPACNRKTQNLGQAIVHLNDHHRWSREAIADWVEVTFEDFLPWAA